MKKRHVLLVSVGAAAIAFAGLAITVSAIESKIAEPGAQSGYIVRAESGGVAVYPEGSQQPESFAEIDISLLREYDRALLEQGIIIQGYDDVIGLLEDFSN